MKCKTLCSDHTGTCVVQCPHYIDRITGPTPGPWEFRTGGAIHGAIYQTGTRHDVAIGVRVADGPLIAAAPDLLAALRNALHAFQTLEQTDVLPRNTCLADLVDCCAAAITKAEGGT